MINTEIRTREELEELVNEIGFLPFFSGNKGFETVITRLQMETYVVPVNYENSRRKNGDEYGWGNCRYDIAENYWGDKLCRSAYKRSSEESLDRLINHIRKQLPRLDEEELRGLLKG